MKKVWMTVALVLIGAAALLAQSALRPFDGLRVVPSLVEGRAGSGPTVSGVERSAPATRAQSRGIEPPATPARAQAVARTTPQPVTGATASPLVLAAEAVKYRAWVNQYCVGCHNSRTASPANEPVNLESASLDDLLPHAATWERVLRKLSVRAMPPQGAPHPKEAEYVGFTSWLAGSLDRAWQGRSTPGRYVVHRLNRTEYGNAIRDLLALDINVTELLPSDGANFGFDNIADSLKTSPLLLERYLTAAQRIGGLAVGDLHVRPGTTEYSISREFSRANTSTDCRLGHAAARWSVMCSRPTASTSSRVDSCGESKKATPASRGMTRRTHSSSRLTAPKCTPRRSAGRRTTMSRRRT